MVVDARAFGLGQRVREIRTEYVVVRAPHTSSVRESDQNVPVTVIGRLIESTSMRSSVPEMCTRSVTVTLTWLVDVATHESDAAEPFRLL